MENSSEKWLPWDVNKAINWVPGKIWEDGEIPVMTPTESHGYGDVWIRVDEKSYSYPPVTKLRDMCFFLSWDLEHVLLPSSTTPTVH